MPKPTTNQVQALIPKWLSFCQKLRLNPGTQTNVADLDWVETLIFTNTTGLGLGLGPGDVYKIKFRDGGGFESINGRIVGYFPGDSAYLGAWADKPHEHWQKFAGTAVKEWQALAEDLRNLLVHDLGVPPAYLDRYRPVLASSGGESTRYLVVWCDKEALRERQWYSLRSVIRAEFDMVTGETKGVRLNNAALLEWQR